MHRMFSPLTQYTRRAVLCPLVPPPENEYAASRGPEYVVGAEFEEEEEDEEYYPPPSSSSWLEDFFRIIKAFCFARWLMPLYSTLMGWSLTAVDLYIDGRNRLCEQPRVKWVLDTTSYWVRRWNRILTEPCQDQWICCASLTRNEYYEKYQEPEYIDLTLSDPMHYGVVLSDENVQRDFMWMYRNCKEGGAYHIRSMRQDMHLVLQPVPSNVRFLSVEYKHPGMDFSVSLDIPVGMYYAGNHLFTSVFVARMLAYTVGDKGLVFDDEYSLHIMDKNLQYVELDAYQWIRLDPCGTAYSVESNR